MFSYLKDGFDFVSSVFAIIGGIFAFLVWIKPTHLQIEKELTTSRHAYANYPWYKKIYVSCLFVKVEYISQNMNINGHKLGDVFYMTWNQWNMGVKTGGDFLSLYKKK